MLNFIYSLKCYVSYLLWVIFYAYASFVFLHNVGIYSLRFLETVYRLLDYFGLHWIKFSNWLLQACYDLRVDAVNQIVNIS